MEEVRQEFKSQDDRIDSKIESLIQIQKERLALEREHLQFECERAGLPRMPGELLFSSCLL